LSSLNVMARLFSLAALIAAWYLGSALATDPNAFPAPQTVGHEMWDQFQSRSCGGPGSIERFIVRYGGCLTFHLCWTIWRVILSFAIAMAIGTALGVAMGRSRLADDLADPWLVTLLNMPALVIIVLAYVWGGLSETAGIIAVVLNKLPNATVTVREGARSLDRQLEEMAQVFRMSPWVQLRHVIIPQLAPYLAAATRSGLSLVWKIVLIVELLGRPNGVGFEIGTAFQLFNVTRILAYAIAFVLIMLAIETFLVQPLERFVSRWRPKAV
jgi:NitT/TauT family transport system permease protein